MEAVLRAISPVNERRNALRPIPTQAELSIRGTKGFGEGNTLTNKKKAREITEAAANAVLAAIIPQGLVAYALTRALLTAQDATAVEKTPKY